uniref:Glycos_transf_1 domain-containing protein n=1 Tax=Toxocara canis TaxID=6265 RepID=A0A183U5U3_TOXCA
LKCDGERALSEQRQVQLLSVGQIRPEKDHRLQICALAELKKRLNADGIDCSVRLVVCGGCRHEEDHERALELQRYAEQLGLTEKDIEWALNVPIDTLCSLMRNSLIGLHTMQNEHFGISVVEGIAAGQIMIAHNSGGPKLDILNAITPEEEHRIGFLATSVRGELFVFL